MFHRARSNLFKAVRKIRTIVRTYPYNRNSCIVDSRNAIILYQSVTCQTCQVKRHKHQWLI